MYKKTHKPNKYCSEYSIFTHALDSILRNDKPMAIKPLEIMPLEKCKLEAVIKSNTQIKENDQGILYI